jgi:predicted ATPase
MNTILRGWALAEHTHNEEGIILIRQGLDAYQSVGAELARPSFLSFLAAAYGKIGRPDEGLTAIAEALAALQHTGERFHEAELYRLKGELVLQSGGRSSDAGHRICPNSGATDPRPLTPDPQAEAEACFLKAIEIARRQGAKSWELRATTSLSRLWQQQRRMVDAYQRLREISAWFTEGFDTPDIKEASNLLDQLSASLV